MNVINRLLEAPCCIIDFLPQQVPENCEGQFFEVEEYLLNCCDGYGLKDRFIRVILKMMCYYPISIYCHEWIEKPTPKHVVESINIIMENHSGDVNILFTSKDVLFQFVEDTLNINIYNPDEEMRVLLAKIADSEGLFFRQAE